MTTEEQLATFKAGVLLLQHQKDRIAELEAALEAKHQQYVGAVIQLEEARKDAERRRLALEEVLDALGALSNPYELEGYGIPDERKAEILDAAQGTK